MLRSKFILRAASAAVLLFSIWVMLFNVYISLAGLLVYVLIESLYSYLYETESEEKMDLLIKLMDKIENMFEDIKDSADDIVDSEMERWNNG